MRSRIKEERDEAATAKENWERIARAHHQPTWSNVSVLDGQKLGTLDAVLLEFDAVDNGKKHHTMDYGADIGGRNVGFAIEFFVPSDELDRWKPTIHKIVSELTYEHTDDSPSPSVSRVENNIPSVAPVESDTPAVPPPSSATQEPEQSNEQIEVSICVDTRDRATEWCSEVTNIRASPKEARRMRRCRLHKPPPEK